MIYSFIIIIILHFTFWILDFYCFGILIRIVKIERVERVEKEKKIIIIEIEVLEIKYS